MYTTLYVFCAFFFDVAAEKRSIKVYFSHVLGATKSQKHVHLFAVHGVFSFAGILVCDLSMQSDKLFNWYYGVSEHIWFNQKLSFAMHGFTKKIGSVLIKMLYRYMYGILTK